LKNIIITFCSILLYSCCFGQQSPYYTQYILNNFLINPAVAGMDNYTDIKASHRVQWEGLQDAPVTTYLTVNGPVKRKLYDVDRETPTSVYPSGRNPMLGGDSYQPPDEHSGIGLTMMNDATGPLNRFSVAGAYSYHLNLTRTSNLALGVSAGFSQLSLDPSKLNFATSNDPAVGANTSGLLSKLNPDLSVGLWLYSKNYFIGLAANQIIPDKIYFSSYSSQNPLVTTKGTVTPNIFAQAGYKCAVNEDLTFMPSVLVKYISPLPISFDINAKLEYQNMMWVGASYRYQDGYAAMLGINLNYRFNLGYSYSYTTSALNSFSSGTHEILLGFLIGNRYNDYYPRNAW